MFCEKCGMNNTGSASVCLRCGYPLMQAPSRRRKDRRSSGIGALITVGIFMVLSAVLVILTFL